MSNFSFMVWPDKYDKAISNLKGPHMDAEGKTFQPVTGHAMSLHEALETQHRSDAHITLYALIDQHGDTGPIPLMKKHILQQVRDEKCDLVSVAAFFDWDTPGKVPLSPELLIDFLTRFTHACDQDERLAAWSCCYTTRHGARVVYELESPVPVDDFEKHHTSMLHTFKDLGVDMDINCRDWTRRYRLPKVVRDNLPSWEEPLFDIRFQERKLDIRLFKKADLRSMVVIREFQRTLKSPTQEECDAVLYVPGAQNKPKKSNFYKRAETIITQSTHYGPRLFDGSMPLCGDTGRNDAFAEMLGVIVPKLMRSCRATALQIFAIFSGPLDALELMAGKQEPRDHFWKFLQDVYEREYAVFVKEKEEEAEAVERGQNTLERMVLGMRQWCDNEKLFHPDNSVRESFVKSRIFSNMGHYFYPMTEDGWYGSLCLTREQLIPRIRKSYLNDIISTEKTDMKGELVSMSPVEIINNHSTVVNEIRMSPLQGVEGRIDDMDGDCPILKLPMYRRNEFLPAEHNLAVEGWLRALFGKYYEIGIKWIGYALDFEAGPICALSIAGAGGVGKKMLVEGLSECLLDPQVATGHDLCGSTNGAIMKTPFLVVNEGMPKARDMAPPDTFKALTAGDPIRVRELYKPPVNVINPMRLVFTANDHGPLQELTRGKELTPQTRKAIGERLLHIDVDDAAEKYLKRLGGRSFTEKEGHRWIRGENDQPTNYVVAKHFMYLYKNRPPRIPTDRFCVMGNCNESDSFNLASQSEHLPAVMRGVIGLIETKGPLGAKHAFISKTGGVFVTVQGVFAQIREVNQERCGERAMEGIIENLRFDNLQYERGGLRFKRLNPGAILDWACPRGVACPLIEKAYAISKEELP